MQFIVDTRILLWSLENPNRLSLTQVQAIENPANTVLVSAASIAEIAIKCSIGKLQIKGDLLSAISNSGFEILDYTGEEAILLEDLPFHHRDPNIVSPIVLMAPGREQNCCFSAYLGLKTAFYSFSRPK